LGVYKPAGTTRGNATRHTSPPPNTPLQMVDYSQCGGRYHSSPAASQLHRPSQQYRTVVTNQRTLPARHALQAFEYDVMSTPQAP